jgi:cardiolipin synthase
MADPDDPVPIAEAPVESDPRADRILTIPNAITVVRLACLPLFLYLLFGRDNRVAAAILLAVLGATDFVDGYVARHFNQVSTVGKVLDPVADRLLFFVGVGAILLDGSVPTWVAATVLTREALVSIAVLALAAFGASRIDVTWYGKAGTFFLMFAFPLFLGGHSTARVHSLSNALGWVATVPGLAFSLYAAALYVPLARRALREGRGAGRRVRSDA